MGRVTATDTTVRCSTWAREVDLSPIGTVGTYAAYVLIEAPLPWPKDVGLLPSLAPVAEVLEGRNVRIQALVPSSFDAPPSEHRVILHRRARGDGGFLRYERSETVAGDSLPDAVERLLSAAPSASPGLQPSPVDVLVCTHGRRDVCCGSQGTDLALRLLAGGPPEGVSYRRTSHTGGHRFAPTFLVLPQGTGWAFAAVELVDQVLERRVPFSQVAAHYRGCAGLDGPQVQAVEREVLTSVGWELLDRHRSGYPTGETTADGGAVVRLEAGSDRWEAVVAAGRTLPVPDCMKPLSETKKTETEWRVSELRSLS